LPDTNDLLDRFISGTIRSLKPRGVMELLSPCRIYKEKDCFAYMEGLMPEEDMKKFEEHSLACPACRAVMGAIHERDQLENRTLLQKTIYHMAELNKLKKSKVLDIVIRVSQKAFDVLSTSGRFKATPVPIPTRSDLEKQEPHQQVRIRKDIDDPPVSLEITLENEASEHKVLMRLSLMNRETETFLSNVRINIEGPDFQAVEETDQNGLASSLLPVPRNYRLTLNDSRNLISGLRISLELRCD